MFSVSHFPDRFRSACHRLQPRLPSPGAMLADLLQERNYGARAKQLSPRARGEGDKAGGRTTPARPDVQTPWPGIDSRRTVCQHEADPAVLLQANPKQNRTQDPSEPPDSSDEITLRASDVASRPSPRYAAGRAPRCTELLREAEASGDTFARLAGILVARGARESPEVRGATPRSPTTPCPAHSQP